jgi:EAL domain-containing protein (putative c-di-GMP-specific phosphodiesterase class I)
MATTPAAPPAATPVAANALDAHVTAPAHPPALTGIGLLDIHLPDRALTLNTAMRRLLGLPTGAGLTWDELLLQLPSADRLRLQGLVGDAEGEDGPLPTPVGPWSLVSLAGAAPRSVQLQCEVLQDRAGRRRLCCLVTPTLPAVSATPATPTRSVDGAADASGCDGAPAGSAASAPRARGRASLEVVTSLPGAAARHELELLYQPQLDVSRGHLRAVEALIRWNHPQLGLVEPRAFLPWAEECGLIVEIGRWALQQACQQARHWRDLGLPQVPMAVNISAAQLEAPDFMRQVEQALALAGLPASGLELELTESILLHESDRVRQHLAACRRLGVRIALDDFGTGQANLSRLHRLPLDKLKLDPSFIRHLNVDRGAQAIVRSMVGLGHQLGLSVVAEGVEQGQQLAQLGELRCDAYQGHLATPALGADALTQRLLAQAAG